MSRKEPNKPPPGVITKWENYTKTKGELMQNATDKELAAAFNEWLRRYEEEPERFNRELSLIKEFRKQLDEGSEPHYGGDCVFYLKQILEELRGS